MLGLTSVTFRGLSVDRIAALAAETGLDGVEWGGDVHVPAGNMVSARQALDALRLQGLRTLSYGTYYRLCQSTDVKGMFTPVLDTALALEAPRIRVWAGEISCVDADADYKKRAQDELAEITLMGREAGVVVATEYHRNTLTQCAWGAEELLGAADGYTYWQPNPDISHEEHLREIEALKRRIVCAHVFQWQKGNIREALSCGTSLWADYIAALPKGIDYILEFVRDDSEACFLEDAETLKGWLAAR